MDTEKSSQLCFKHSVDSVEHKFQEMGKTPVAATNQQTMHEENLEMVQIYQILP